MQCDFQRLAIWEYRSRWSLNDIYMVGILIKNIVRIQTEQGIFFPFGVG